MQAEDVVQKITPEVMTRIDDIFGYKPPQEED